MRHKQVLTRYLVVRLTIEAPDTANPEEVTRDVGRECSYHVKYNSEGVRIVDTEMLDILEECPDEV